MSFRSRLLIAFVIIGAGLTSAATWYFYSVARQQALNQLRTRLTDLARMGSVMLDADQRQAIESLDREVTALQQGFDPAALKKIKPGDVLETLSAKEVAALEAKPEFQAIAQTLRRIKHATRTSVVRPGLLAQFVEDENDQPQIRFAYILAPIVESPDYTRLRFIADSDYEEIDGNRNGTIDEDETATKIGMIYNSKPFPAMIQSLRGVAGQDKDFSKDAWGYFLSAYVPIYDAGGRRVIALLGIDLDANGPFNALRRVLYFAIGVSVSSLILSIIAAWAAARHFSRPIRSLIDAADRVRARDFEAQAPVLGRDELGRLAQTFNSMVSDIKNYSQGLETMVQLRTRELQQALEQVEGLKLKQDADYYLTTLLTNPLLRNNNRGPTLQTDFLIEQKKRFRYRNSEANLGGDVCLTGELHLREQRWMLFINGDAMGKSMQGAGGALVLATAVNAMLQRHQNLLRTPGASAGLNQTPEQWLREACTELQQIFLTFDGSMYVSCIMGLIHQQSGMMHFFNAEHPRAILYRNREAFFIEEAPAMRKLGFQFASGFRLNSFQLLPGDILIVGSDGKDDLRLPAGDDETKMNEDEALALTVVRECEADLQRMRDRLRELGEVIDDLSLLRVRFDPNAVAREESLDPILKQAAELIRKREYIEALSVLNRQPAQDRGFFSLYYRGLCLAAAGQPQDAENVLLQAYAINRRQTAVHRLLGRIYLRFGKADRAELFLREAESIDPEHPGTRSLLAKINRRP